jgi:hypothetical protein
MPAGRQLNVPGGVAAGAGTPSAGDIDPGIDIGADMGADMGEE